MNAPTYLKPLRIQIASSIIKVGKISPCCGSVRVEGWIDAPNKNEGFEASRTLGRYFGLKSASGYCDVRTETEGVSFPFCFDVESELVAPTYRREDMNESIKRVTVRLRRAGRHFIELASIQEKARNILSTSSKVS